MFPSNDKLIDEVKHRLNLLKKNTYNNYSTESGVKYFEIRRVSNLFSAKDLIKPSIINVPKGVCLTEEKMKLKIIYFLILNIN